MTVHKKTYSTGEAKRAVDSYIDESAVRLRARLRQAQKTQRAKRKKEGGYAAHPLS